MFFLMLVVSPGAPESLYNTSVGGPATLDFPRHPIQDVFLPRAPCSQDRLGLHYSAEEERSVTRDLGFIRLCGKNEGEIRLRITNVKHRDEKFDY